MDKEIVILLIGMLIIGLAGGFILSFVAFQPQIQSLKSDLSSLEDEIDSRFAENEETLSDLNEVISNLSSVIDNLNFTSETAPENETEVTYEPLEVQAQATSNGTHFEINFSVLNSAATPATLASIYLFQYPIQDVPDIVSLVLNGTTYPNKTFTLTLPAGASVDGTMTIIEGEFQSGTFLEFRFISPERYNNPVIVSLP